VLKLFKTMAIATLLYWRENCNVEERKYFRPVAEYTLHNNKTNIVFRKQQTMSNYMTLLWFIDVSGHSIYKQ